MDIYTIIFAVLAVVIWLRLLSVLGQRTGHERPYTYSAFLVRLVKIGNVLAAVLLLVQFVVEGFDVSGAKWRPGLAASATAAPTISRSAHAIEGDTVILVGILVAMVLCAGTALVLSYLHLRAKRLDRPLCDRPTQHDLPASNPVRPGPHPEQRLRNLRSRFRAVSARHAVEGRIPLTGILLTVTAVALGAVFFDVGSAKWHPVPTTATPATPAPTAAATTISGPARVIDGDTVVVAGTHVRLKGVDVAELGTARGENARRVMASIVTGELTCRLTGEKTYRREVGYYTTTSGTDINQAIIAQGAALACPRYDGRYVRFEQSAALAAQPRSSYCVKH